MRKYLAIIVGIMFLFISPLSLAAEAPSHPPIKVFLNNQELNFDSPPIIDSGNTLVPLRGIFEAMGAQVDWNSITQTATASDGIITVVITLGSTTPTINGTVKPILVPAKIVNDRMMAPLRFVGEAFGGEVAWDSATYTVHIYQSALAEELPYNIDLPEGWIIEEQMQKQLKAQLIATHDNQKEMAGMVFIGKEQTAGLIDLAKYVEMDFSATKIITTSFSPELAKKFQLDGYPAEQYVIKVIVQDLEMTYLTTYLETETHLIKIFLVCDTITFEQNRAAFEEITQTFKKTSSINQ